LIINVFIVFYNFLWVAVYLLTFPYVLFKRRTLPDEWRERCGEYGFDFSGEDKSIWIHGASVGEITAASRLASKIQEKYPKRRIVISAMTHSGKERAIEIMDRLRNFVFLPFDFLPMVRKSLRSINPQVLILIETEIWPSLLFLAKRRGVKIILANARLSEKTFRRYKMVKSFSRLLFRQIDMILPKEEGEKSKFLELGVENSRLREVGSLKLDNSNPVPVSRDSLSLSEESFIVVAGSVRKGEEESIIKAFELLRKDVETAFLIIAPRHLNRVDNVENILMRRCLKFRHRTDRISTEESNILILDTIGELSNVYSIADVAFVGGTLLNYGGHNLLEPAFFSIPILIGPFAGNIKESAKELVKLKGAKIVKNEYEICSALSYLFNHPKKRDEMGRNAKQYTKTRKGTVNKYINILEELKVI